MSGGILPKLDQHLLPRTIQVRLALLFSAVFIATLAVTYAVDFFGLPLTGYDGRFGEYQRRAADRLSHTAQVTEHRIVGWLDERRCDLHLFADNGGFVSHVEVLATMAERFGTQQQPRSQASAAASASPSLGDRLRANEQYHDARAWLNEIHQTFRQYVELTVADMHGVILVSTDESRVGSSVARDVFGKSAFQTDEYTIIGIACNDGQQPILTLSHAVTDGAGRPIGVLVLHVAADYMLPTILNAARSSPSVDALLLDRHGRCIASARGEAFGESDCLAAVADGGDPPADWLPAEPHGVISTTDDRGEPILAAYRRVTIDGGPQWAVVVQQDLASIWAPIYRELLPTIGVLVAAGVALIGLATAVARGVGGPLRQLSQTAAEASKGRLDVRAPVRGTREMRQLADAFNVLIDRVEHWHHDMEQEVAARTAELADSNRALTVEAEQRKRIQEELLRAHTELDHVFNAAVPLAVIDLDGRLLRVNQTFARLLGSEAEQLIAQQCRKACAIDRCESPDCPLKLIVGGEQQVEFETQLYQADGRELTCAITCIPYRDSNNQLVGMVESLTDITAQRQAFAALRESEKRFRDVFNTSADAILIFNTDGEIAWANPAASEMYGYTEGEMTGLSSRDIAAPDHYRIFDNFKQQLRQGGCFHGESINVCKDGRRMNVEIRGSEFNYKGEAHLLAIIRDITERKRSEAELERYRNHLEELIADRTQELRETQETLLRQERLAALGKLTGAVSHELRNPLGTIRTATYLLARRIREHHPELEDILSRMERGIVRCDAIISDLLDFARGQTTLQSEPVQLDEWLAGMLDEFDTPPSVELTRELHAPVSVRIDPERFRRCLINLLSNAVQALPDGQGKVTVRSRAADGSVSISVTDTGCGIEPEEFGKILEPLYSTKSFGVGLGLPIVAGLVQQHGGQLSVESQPGRGTTVTIDLPVDNASAATEQTVQPASTPAATPNG